MLPLSDFDFTIIRGFANGQEGFSPVPLGGQMGPDCLLHLCTSYSTWPSWSHMVLKLVTQSSYWETSKLTWAQQDLEGSNWKKWPA